jgi:hypothetical protein
VGFCTNCGHLLQEGTKFCGNCGHSAFQTEPPPPASEEQSATAGEAPQIDRTTEQLTQTVPSSASAELSSSPAALPAASGGWWVRRSQRGKTGIIIGAVLAALILVVALAQALSTSNTTAVPSSTSSSQNSPSSSAPTTTTTDTTSSDLPDQTSYAALRKDFLAFSEAQRTADLGTCAAKLDASDAAGFMTCMYQTLDPVSTKGVKLYGEAVDMYNVLPVGGACENALDTWTNTLKPYLHDVLSIQRAALNQQITRVTFWLHQASPLVLKGENQGIAAVGVCNPG